MNLSIEVSPRTKKYIVVIGYVMYSTAYKIKQGLQFATLLKNIVTQSATFRNNRKPLTRNSKLEPGLKSVKDIY